MPNEGLSISLGVECECVEADECSFVAATITMDGKPTDTTLIVAVFPDEPTGN